MDKNKKVSMLRSDFGIVTQMEASQVHPMTEYEAMLAMRIRGYKRISQERKNGKIVEVWAKRKRN